MTADAFVVTFADSLLEVGIRAALMQPEGDLLHPDLETLTVLDVATDSITSLSGLEFVRDLVDLDLRGNQITGISPLSSLQHLEILDLSDNTIGNFTPLAGLVLLRELDLENTGLSSLSPLAEMTSGRANGDAAIEPARQRHRRPVGLLGMNALTTSGSRATPSTAMPGIR